MQIIVNKEKIDIDELYKACSEERVLRLRKDRIESMVEKLKEQYPRYHPLVDVRHELVDALMERLLDVDCKIKMIELKESIKGKEGCKHENNRN